MKHKKLLTILGLAAGTIMNAGLLRSESPAKTAQMHDGHQLRAEAANMKEFTMIGVEYQGSKMWLPGTMIVKQGAKVRIKLINNIQSEPNTHGFSLDEFGIKVVVARGTPQTVEFTADKEGLFKYYCQIHPAHVGGQMLVLK